MKLHSFIVVGIVGALAACGSGAGDPAVCQEPTPRCDFDLVAAVDTFSRESCESAIDNYWCGVNAQALAECLHNAQVCLQTGTTRETIASVLAASVCAQEFEEWDDCFGNGDTDSDHDDDDWDD
ncbi:MAG: hypothetical protein H0T42_31230 [Deltaproteobacteria bacterium]|nr:hypothetical protein [Deltaproteobacteria bacterium]